MKRTLSIIVLLFLLFPLLSQTIVIKGRIIDETTKQGVPYVNMCVLHQDAGTSSTNDGSFLLEIKKDFANDTIRLSSVGYEPLLFEINKLNNKEIKLKPQIYTLSEVKVTPRKLKTMIVNPVRKKDIGGRRDYSKYPAIETLFFPYKSEYENTEILKEVWVYINNEIKTSYFALRIFFPGPDGAPDYDLLKEPLIVTTKASAFTKTSYKLVKINVEKYNIRFPKSGIFIGLEKLFISENMYVENGITCYAPTFANILSRKYSNGWLYSEGQWNKYKENLGKRGEHFAFPPITLVLMD